MIFGCEITKKEVNLLNRQLPFWSFFVIILKKKQYVIDLAS